MSSSFTHSLYRWLPFTNTQVHIFPHRFSLRHTRTYTHRHTHTVANCGATRERPHLWFPPSSAKTMMLSVESCWTYHHTSRFLCLVPVFSRLSRFILCVCGCIWSFEGISVTQIGCRWGKKESCGDRRRVREMKYGQIAVLSEALLLIRTH